jgi:hypothetical protein
LPNRDHAHRVLCGIALAKYALRNLLRDHARPVLCGIALAKCALHYRAHPVLCGFTVNVLGDIDSRAKAKAKVSLDYGRFEHGGSCGWGCSDFYRAVGAHVSRHPFKLLTLQGNLDLIGGSPRASNPTRNYRASTPQLEARIFLATDELHGQAWLAHQGAAFCFIAASPRRVSQFAARVMRSLSASMLSAARLAMLNVAMVLRRIFPHCAGHSAESF